MTCEFQEPGAFYTWCANPEVNKYLYAPITCEKARKEGKCPIGSKE